MENFKLDEYVKRGEALLKQTKDVFMEYGLDEIALPQTMELSPDDAIRLVFVGQYSSGKSTIIKTMTGIDTGIGAGIQTQETRSYPWNDGMYVVDTPGIHTEIRQDHDEKTYEEINHSSLLIFVITNEGFNDRIGNHFRHLAIEQGRGKNMVLVVNKMERTSEGNTPEQQAIIAEDIKKVIEPLSPQDVYLSFIDAQSFIAAQNAAHEEDRALY